MTELKEAVGKVLEFFGFFEIAVDDACELSFGEGGVAQGDFIFHGYGGERGTKFMAGVGDEVGLLLGHFMDGLEGPAGEKIAGASAESQDAGVDEEECE